VLRAGRFPSPGASEPSWSCRSLQSLVRQRRSEVIGFLAPGTSSTRACAGPAGIPLTVRTVSLSGCRCLSPGIRFPFTAYSRIPCPHPFECERLSWGFLMPLQRSRTGSSRPRVFRPEQPGLRRFSRRVPPRRVRCRSQVFTTSQRLLSSASLPPFSDGSRSWGSALQGFAPRNESPIARRDRRALLTFSCGHSASCRRRVLALT
jgi:hypothetical protein